MEKKKCKTEVYSRVTGYYSPTSQWNKGKNEERKDRKKFDKELKGASKGHLMRRKERCKVCNKPVDTSCDITRYSHGGVRVLDKHGDLKYCLCSLHATFNVEDSTRRLSMDIEKGYTENPKKCKMCKEMFYPNSRNQKYCDECRGV